MTKKTTKKNDKKRPKNKPGYAPAEITVLTPYLGQLKKIRTILSQLSINVLIDDRDKLDLIKHGLEGGIGMYVCMYVCMCVCTYVYMYVYMYIYIYLSLKHFSSITINI